MTPPRWRLFLLGGLAVIGCYLLVSGLAFAQLVVYPAITAAAGVALLVGSRSHPPQRRRPWQVMAAAEFLTAVADVMRFAWEPVTGAPPTFPSAPDWLYPVAYVLLIAGLVGLIRARTPGRDWPGLLDATIIATGFAVVAWVLLIEPLAADTSTSLAARVLATAYPTLNVLRFAVGVRLAVRMGSRPPALLLLLAALGLAVVTDVVYALLQPEGAYQDGHALDAGWMLAVTLLGAAALHPTARDLSEPTGDVPMGRGDLRRTVLLAAASFVVPVMILLIGAHGVVLDVATAWLFLLVLVRMGMLARALERSAVEVQELQRERRERWFRALVQHSAHVVIVLDLDGMVTYASPSARWVVGDDVTGWHRDRLLAFIDADDVERFVAHMATVRRQPDAAADPVQVRFRPVDGATRHWEVIATNLLDDADVGGVVLNARDVTERAVLEDRLRHQALHDQLTDLANRALFDDRIRHALERARASGQRVAALFCDVDDFKTINDSLGHDAGDQLLVIAAHRMRRCLRAGDTAARLGGDEFGILLEGLVDNRQAFELAERLLAVMREPIMLSGTRVVSTISIGIAFGSFGQHAEDLLRNADVAMRTVKADGKAAWRRYEPSMHASELARVQLVGDLEHAVARNEFFLVYQPIVDLASGAAVGAEALVRWRHPDRGVVPPGEFIPLAEETGHVLALGRWVLRQACLQAARWLERLPADTPFSINVNVSARQLQDPGLVDEVVASLQQAALSPRRLVLELTESMLLHDPEEALRTFGALKLHGVRLAIDDFGTGYSSLSYLRRLPVDIIKIDKAFVDDLDGVPAEQTLTRGIVELTRTLGVTALAEGIERASQVDTLRSMGCALGQGFHYARPLDADAMWPLLAGRTSSSPPHGPPTEAVGH
ncbi:MAG: EAL domain-containing protein [Actinobacteria bacterium]|nr:EAL domain-containing protein [Actinomycetota bacterium]